MHEVLLVLSGTIIDTVFTAAGVFLGAWLVKRTYSEFTHPQPLLYKIEEDDTDSTVKPEDHYAAANVPHIDPREMI